MGKADAQIAGLREDFDLTYLSCIIDSCNLDSGMIERQLRNSLRCLCKRSNICLIQAKRKIQSLKNQHCRAQVLHSIAVIHERVANADLTSATILWSGTRSVCSRTLGKGNVSIRLRKTQMQRNGDRFLYRRQWQHRERQEKIICRVIPTEYANICSWLWVFSKGKEKRERYFNLADLILWLRAFFQSSSSALIHPWPCHHEQREPWSAVRAKGWSTGCAEMAAREGSSAFAPSPPASPALPRYTSPLLPNPSLQNIAEAAWQLSRPPRLWSIRKQAVATVVWEAKF